MIMTHALYRIWWRYSTDFSQSLSSVMATAYPQSVSKVQFNLQSALHPFRLISNPLLPSLIVSRVLVLQYHYQRVLYHRVQRYNYHLSPR